MRKILLLFFFSSLVFASDEEPYWEYGVGIGFVRVEHYPSAGEYNEVYLPVPTFQYRGRRLRADDREGAKAYLWKNENLSLEMSGTGTTYLESKDNKLRQDMDDIPWVVAIGPKLVYKFNSDLNTSFGVFQAVFTDFDMTKVSGVFLQGQVSYTYDFHLTPTLKSFTKYDLTLKGASSEIQNQYFGVEAKDVTATRSFYKARAGFLSAEVSIFQSFKTGRVAYYLGANYAHYGAAKNQDSPLFKANYQFNYLFGVTYVLGESSRLEVKEEDTSGFMNR